MDRCTIFDLRAGTYAKTTAKIQKETLGEMSNRDAIIFVTKFYIEAFY